MHFDVVSFQKILLESKKYVHELKNQWQAARWYNPAEINKMVQGFVGHVDRYQIGTDGGKDNLHWSTYAACIRRSGGFYSTFRKPKREHYWQARTYVVTIQCIYPITTDHSCSVTILWQPHAVSWSQLFGNRAQDGATTLQSLIRDGAESYCTRIKNSPEIPVEFKHVLCSSAYKVQNISGEYTATLLKAVSRFQEGGDQIRQETREWLIELMSDAYSDAQKATGK